MIPNSILASFDQGKLSKDKKTLILPDKKNIGWIIDGQHRFLGAHHAEKDIYMSIIAFLGLEVEDQIQQFVTINKEAKGVPTSLYIDLLPHLKNKKPADLAKERAADIATQLKRDEQSPFFSRIVITTSPRKGELSLANFARKVTPLILEGKGILSAYTEREQTAVISNYYIAIKNAFPNQFKKHESIFFQTLGFGALINALPTFFSICLKNYKGFTAEDATKVFNKIKHFDFSDWSKKGTGSSAEIEAAEDLKVELTSAFEDAGEGISVLRI